MTVPMTVVFDDAMYVAAGTLFVSSLGDEPPTLPDDEESAFVAQTNGLLGAAVPGELAIAVALQSGYLGVRVETCDTAPDVTPDWEDVVEVSFTPLDPDVVFLNFDADAQCEMTLERQPYRVRLCARNMDDAASRRIVIDEDEPVVDQYCVSFWPAAEAPDEVLRCGSQVAADKHASRGT